MSSVHPAQFVHGASLRTTLMDQGTAKLAWELCQDVSNAAMIQLAPSVLSIVTSSTPQPILAHLARRLTQVAYPAMEVGAFNARKASLLM